MISKVHLGSNVKIGLQGETRCITMAEGQANRKLLILACAESSEAKTEVFALEPCSRGWVQNTKSYIILLSYFLFSITLHFKISCPASPAFNYSRNPVFMVPQVKIEMESDYDFTDMDKYRRETDSETTL